MSNITALPEVFKFEMDWTVKIIERSDKYGFFEFSKPGEKTYYNVHFIYSDDGREFIRPVYNLDDDNKSKELVYPRFTKAVIEEKAQALKQEAVRQYKEAIEKADEKFLTLCNEAIKMRDKAVTEFKNTVAHSDNVKEMMKDKRVIDLMNLINFTDTLCKYGK